MGLKINPEEIKTLIEARSEQETDYIIFEEPAELIHAFSKFKRYGGLREIGNLFEEMADVYIVLEMLKEKLNIDDTFIQKVIDSKMKRNLERIKGE